MDWNTLNPTTWDWNEKKAAGRHVLTAAGSVVATLAVVGLLNNPDSATLQQGLTDVGQGLEQFAKGVGAIVGVLMTIYAGLMAKGSASPSSQIKSVVATLSAPQAQQDANALIDPNSRKDIIAAVAKMPEVQAVVAPSVAATIPSHKVVATPEQVPPVV